MHAAICELRDQQVYPQEIPHKHGRALFWAHMTITLEHSLNIHEQLVWWITCGSHASQLHQMDP